MLWGLNSSIVSAEAGSVFQDEKIGDNILRSSVACDHLHEKPHSANDVNYNSLTDTWCVEKYKSYVKLLHIFIRRVYDCYQDFSALRSRDKGNKLKMKL